MDKRTYRGQVYWCVGVEPHTRLDGGITKLATWETACAECGATFSFKRTVHGFGFSPNRRCSEHHRPGAKVRQRRTDHAQA